MSEDNSERPQKVWKVTNPSLYRKGRTNVNLTGVSVNKLYEAAKRGIRIDKIKLVSGEIKADIDKIVIQGDDEPNIE